MLLRTLVRDMQYGASLVVAVAVRGLCGLWRSLSWFPSRSIFGWGRCGAATSSETSAAHPSVADDGYGIERWDQEFYRDPLDLPQVRLVQLGVASQESRHSTQVLFRNGVVDPPERCRLFWVDYAGKIVRYKTLYPGETHRQQTFESHPWTFATVPERGSHEPKQRLVVNGAPLYFPRRGPAVDPNEPTVVQEEQSRNGTVLAVVERPNMRQWTHDTNKHYPAWFKTIGKAFITTHAALRLGERVTELVENQNEQDIEPSSPRRSRRIQEIEKSRNSTDGAPSDVGPASAEDDLGGFELENEGRCSIDPSQRPDEGERFSGERFYSRTSLGNLPPELAARILELAAPKCPLYRTVEDVVQDAIRIAGDSSGTENEDVGEGEGLV